MMTIAGPAKPPPAEANKKPTDGAAVNANLQAMFRDLGLLLQLPGLMALPSLAIAWAVGETYTLPGFALLALLSLGGGQWLYRSCRGAGEGDRPRALMTVALAWLLIPLLGALPFYAAALLGAELSEATRAFRQPLNALFEAMSGFTSTGLSMSRDPSALPLSLQWWRSFSEWVGGVGVIVLALALIQPAEDDYALYRAEARSRRLGDDLRQTARRIWALYLTFTAAAVAGFAAAGMPVWEALNHGLTGISTGGFTVTSDSFQSYGAPVKAVAVAVMLLGAISFLVHYMLWVKRDWRRAWRQTQTRTFVILLAAGLLLLTASRTLTGGGGSLLDTLFQWVSALGTCGFTAVPTDEWPAAPLLVLIVGMLIGGMAGSTTGGLKTERLAWLAKGWFTRWRGYWPDGGQPQSVFFNGERYRPDAAQRRVSSVAALAFVWLLTWLLGTLALAFASGDSHALHEVGFEAISALGSVGLSAGVTDTGLHWSGRVTLIALMWMGRLEIMAVLVLVGAPLAAARRR